MFKLADEINDADEALVALLLVSLLAKLLHGKRLGVLAHKRHGRRGRFPRQTKVRYGLRNSLNYGKIWVFLQQAGGASSDVILMIIHWSLNIKFKPPDLAAILRACLASKDPQRVDRHTICARTNTRP